MRGEMIPAAAQGHGGPRRPPWRLVEEILAMSVVDNWHQAREEWTLADVWFSPPDSLGRCVCGHAIREHCLIRNDRNSNTAVVGNCCVKRFIGLETSDLFAGFRRIMVNPDRALNQEAVEYAYARGWLNDWELNFCLNNLNKRRLSPKQRAKRAEINSRVIVCLEVAGLDRGIDR